MVRNIYDEANQLLIQKLINARREANLTQNQVAQRINKTQSYISKIESGQIRIDVFTLKELARIYGKDLTYFI